MKSSDAKTSKCHLKFSSLMMYKLDKNYHSRRKFQMALRDPSFLFPIFFFFFNPSGRSELNARGALMRELKPPIVTKFMLLFSSHYL